MAGFACRVTRLMPNIDLMDARAREIALWTVVASMGFGGSGFAALLLTDFVFSPVASGFASSSSIVAAICIPMAIAGSAAFMAWSVLGWRLFRGWPSVATAAWLSLLLNPAAWLVVMSSLLVFGAVVPGCVCIAAMALAAVWRFTGAPKRLHLA